jgi:hypothetical protein
MFNLLSGNASMDGNISLQFSGTLADVIGWLRPKAEVCASYLNADIYT